MRKRILSFLLAVVLTAGFIVTASAIDELRFSETCKNKTTRSVTLYTWDKETQTLSPTITLKAGTYIRKLAADDVTKATSGMAHILCSPADNDDDYRYGYIESSAIRSAASKVTLVSGKEVSVPEALTKSKTRLNYYLQLEYGEAAASDKAKDEDGKETDIGDDDGEDQGQTGIPGGRHLTDAEWYARMAKAQKANGYDTPTVWTDENGEERSVEVISMGLGISKIKVDKEKQLVPTSSLSWETKAPEDKVLAVVKTNKSGYAVLHSKKTAKSFVMDHCVATSVMRVISTGKNWTMVDYKGLRGYVKTSALTFFDNGPKEYRDAVISFKGRTTYSKNDINVRAGAKNTSRILGKYKVGTPVAIFETNGKWSCIDIDGYHCWVLTEYLTEK